MPTRRSLLPLAGMSLLLAACDPEEPKPDDTGDDTIKTTPHCGDIAGTETWTAGDNRHLLTCDVVVTGTLTLEPGVEIYLENGTTLRIDGGTLEAVGTQNGPILLESAADFPLAGDHGGIVSVDGTVTLDWVTIRHGGAQGALLDLTGGTADIANSTFANGLTEGIVGTGTAFSRIYNVNIAYVPTGLVLPWNATQVLSGIIYDQVDTQTISLPEDTISEDVTIPALDYAFVSMGVTIEAGAQLNINPGGLLQMGGDIVVNGGLSVFGDYASPARVEGLDGAAYAITFDPAATVATFRYALVSDATVLSQGEDFYAKMADFVDAQGDAVTVTGTVKDSDAGNLDGCTFSGTGYGLVTVPSNLASLGDNTFSGSAFDGVVLQGGTLTSDAEMDSLPGDRVLVLGDLTVDGATLEWTGGDMIFADGTSLVVQDGTLRASGGMLTHVGSTPGGWKGLTLGAGTSSSTLDNLEIAYGGADGGANVTVASDATLRSCYVHDSAGWGVWLEGDASPEFEDNTYANNALGDVGP